jgi:hypothetical protein
MFPQCQSKATNFIAINTLQHTAVVLLRSLGSHFFVGLCIQQEDVGCGGSLLAKAMQGQSPGQHWFLDEALA